MDDVTIARALHVLAVVHWIGGVAMVTLVILPALARLDLRAGILDLFEAVEGRFATQARWSVTLVGLTGFWMTWRLDAWDRFAEPGYWWMHAMVIVWAWFTLVLFVAEPLFLHAWFRRRAARDPAGTAALALRAHRVLLVLLVVTVVGAVLGAHGMLY
ncbi:MAG: hypothetical protein AB7I59_02450 [Geminicoccaceae bacterium]